MAPARPRVAIVGAGPAGAYAAASLLRARGGVEIDLFERLATPWGLLRGGVAPDHQEIKRLQDTFDRETLGRGIDEPVLAAAHAGETTRALVAREARGEEGRGHAARLETAHRNTLRITHRTTDYNTLCLKWKRGECQHHDERELLRVRVETL